MNNIKGEIAVLFYMRITFYEVTSIVLMHSLPGFWRILSRMLRNISWEVSVFLTTVATVDKVFYSVSR